MVQPLPPPRTYRAKTRLARCRARQQQSALKSGSTSLTSSSGKSSIANNNNGDKNGSITFQSKTLTQKKEEVQVDSAPQPSWVQFDSATDISTSWSGESDEPEAIEVEVDSRSVTHGSIIRRNWISDPINEDMQEVPVIPLPAPSSVPQTRTLRLSGAPPLQPRDTNAIPRTRGSRSALNTSIEDSPFESNGKIKGPQLKVVSRPIEAPRGRSSKSEETQRARSMSRSRRSRGRSRSIIRVNKSDQNKSDSSLSTDTKATSRSGENETSKVDNSSKRSSRSRSRRRRDRSLSIIRARRNSNSSKSNPTGGPRSPSAASARSANTVKMNNLQRQNTDASPTLRQKSTSSVEEEDVPFSNIARTLLAAYSPPRGSHSRSPPHRGRGKSLDPRSRMNPPLSHRLRRMRGQSLDPQSLRSPRQSSELLNNSDPEIGNSSTEGSDPRHSITLPRPFLTRTLLTSSVYHNQATGIWITTINMNQKSNVTRSNAAKYLKAFSFQTEREARESAYANAPAKMVPFEDNPFCFMCNSKFSVLRRASHCRNCGVCICNQCSVSWNKLSVPETFNVKNETTVKVCKSCDSLSKMFRKSLVDADYERALTIYNTGNINLRCQFMAMKGVEAMLPIHCAAEGGSLRLLQWLVDVHYCPIKRIRTGNRSKQNLEDGLITTSKGRSVLEIAMAGKHVDILNFLVNEKKIGFDGIRTLDVALGALEAVLLAYPRRYEIEDEQDGSEYGSPAPSYVEEIDRPRHTPIRDGIPLYEITSNDTDDESTDTSSNSDVHGMDSDDDESVATTVRDACIICYENSIDCVITPCGHQICCLQCSENMTTCPVCNVNCKFIKTFRP